MDRSPIVPRVLHLLFFCSGASGLIHQVVWVREFGYIFGNTIYSAALVIAVFMCGLRVGSYLGGRWGTDGRAGSSPPTRCLSWPSACWR